MVNCGPVAVEKVAQVRADVEVIVPTVPNFFRLSARHQEQVPEAVRSAPTPEEQRSLPINAFSEDELRWIGAAWTQALVEKAKERGGP